MQLQTPKLIQWFDAPAPNLFLHLRFAQSKHRDYEILSVFDLITNSDPIWYVLATSRHHLEAFSNEVFRTAMGDQLE